MKLLILFAVLITVAIAAPAESDKATVVLKSESEVGVDAFKFAYETSDGTSRQEQAELKNIGGDTPAWTVRGSVTWVAPDGQTYTLNYVADETGYHPEAAHLPVGGVLPAQL